MAAEMSETMMKTYQSNGHSSTFCSAAAHFAGEGQPLA
jgi:hypothetical protein